MVRLFTYHALNLRSASFSNDPRKWPPGASRRTCFGQDVLWHSFEDGGRHVPAAQLETYRQIGDPLLDKVFVCRRQEGRPIEADEDLVAAAAAARPDAKLESERALYDWYNEQHHAHLPTWVDLKMLQRGQDVHLAYLPAISMSL